MQQVISHRGVITWSVLHGGSVLMCAVLHGGNGFFKMVAGNFAWNRVQNVFSFSQLFYLFGKTKFSSEIHIFRSDQFSLSMYRCLLPSSVTVKMDYEENMENARYETNDDTPLWTKDWIIWCCCIKSVTVLLCL